MGGLIERKSWKSSSFPIYCGRRLAHAFHAFISRHVTHLSRPALEQPVPAGCRLHVKNVSVEELVGVQPCSPIFSGGANLCCCSPFSSCGFYVQVFALQAAGPCDDITGQRHHQANIFNPSRLPWFLSRNSVFVVSYVDLNLTRCCERSHFNTFLLYLLPIQTPGRSIWTGA